MIFSRVSFLAAVLLITPAAQAERPPARPLQESCKAISTPVAGNYCIARTPGSTNKDVVFFLHGANGSEVSWGRGKLGRILTTWAKKNQHPPTVVSLSFGKIWLLARKNALARSGLYEYYVNEFIPKIEKELGGIQGRRILVGESMGGFNASQILMKSPELFDRALLMCPAVMSVSPFATNPEIGEFIRRTRANAFMTWGAVGMFRLYYPDEATWRQVSPVHSGESALDSRTPPVHISCGRSDDYGFFEGAEIFATILGTRTTGSVWQPLDGDHCTWDPDQVSDFIVN